MNQQKGFSLTEVLVSLVLASTVALALLEQQLQTKELLAQLVLRVRTSQYLDQVDEHLFVKPKILPNQKIIQASEQFKRIYPKIGNFK